MERVKRKLVLENGDVYVGYGFGASSEAIGEIVFNTSMAGYQEIISDPSYADQIIVMLIRKPHQSELCIRLILFMGARREAKLNNLLSVFRGVAVSHHDIRPEAQLTRRVIAAVAADSPLINKRRQERRSRAPGYQQ